MNYKDFNPRSDERSDPYLLMIFLIFTDFNPRSDERSDCTRQAVPSAFLYFNPRSDERSDSVATSAYNVPFYFNPRSDERSDPALSPVLAPQIYFNPRSDERSDTHNSRRRVDAEISIHGATHITLLLIWLVVFQSTLRRTERRELTFEPLSLCLYFNPRSDERSDHVVLTSAP